MKFVDFDKVAYEILPFHSRTLSDKQRWTLPAVPAKSYIMKETTKNACVVHSSAKGRITCNVALHAQYGMHQVSNT